MTIKSSSKFTITLPQKIDRSGCNNQIAYFQCLYLLFVLIFRSKLRRSLLSLYRCAGISLNHFNFGQKSDSYTWKDIENIHFNAQCQVSRIYQEMNLYFALSKPSICYPLFTGEVQMLCFLVFSHAKVILLTKQYIVLRRQMGCHSSSI